MKHTNRPCNLGIKNLTLYTLSIDNLHNRSEKELNDLFLLHKKACIDVAGDKKIHDNQVNIKFIGNIKKLPINLHIIVPIPLSLIRIAGNYGTNDTNM